MNAFKKGWYTDIGGTAMGEAISVEADEVLFHEKSQYQDILIFNSKPYGRVLSLDNAMQLAEKDDPSYQEMAVFLPLCCHPNPKTVLIIGGGDGGVAREVLKFPSIESVTVCEIDEKVVEASKKFIPFAGKGFESQKVNLFIGDGAEFVKHHKNEFDVIISDSPDPLGPAICLYQKPYFESLKEALKPGGIICAQGESFWLDLDVIKDLVNMCRTLFPMVDYAASYVPSFPGGQGGCVLCGTSPDTDFRNPVQKISITTAADKYGLLYYYYDVHKAAFALPLFVSQELGLL